ncbi:MAG: BT_2262 family domain-containing protein [Prolixibacteraceae bacterium]
MKILKYLSLVLFLSAILSSCEKEYESHITKVTPAPVMELIGDNPIVLFKGTPYVDPGIHAMQIVGTDTTELTYTIENEVKVDIPGSYKLFYKVLNSENVPFYISRRVNIVSFTGYDVFEIPAGTYDGIRVNRGKGGTVQINKLAPGVYQISDLLAGYYDQYVGYGPETAAPAILVISEDGSIRSELGTTAAWGEVVGTNFVFNTATNVLTFKATIVSASFSFDVQFTLQ